MVDEYFTFSFVRNPWDRAVSMYKYLPYSLPFKRFILEMLGDRLWKHKYWFVGPQWEFLCDASGEVGLDFIGRFESFEEDFRTVADRVGLPVRTLPHTNRSMPEISSWERLRAIKKGLLCRDPVYLASAIGQKTWFSDYREYYDDETREFVNQLYKKDIDFFGYSFEN